MSEPDDGMFIYDRRYPPLFFVVPDQDEQVFWAQSMKSITREYFTLSRKWKIHHQTPLSNGITAGEFAMWILTTNHLKRIKVN